VSKVIFQRFDDADREQAFQLHRAERSQATIFWVMIFAVSILLGFVAVDLLLGDFRVYLLAHLPVLGAASLIALWIRRRPASFNANYQTTIVAFAALSALLDIVGLSQLDSAAIETYKGAIPLTLFGQPALLRLRFTAAVSIGCILIGGFTWLTITQGDSTTAVLAHDVTMFTVALLIGLMANWLLEANARQNFSLLHKLETKVGEVETAHGMLETSARLQAISHKEVLDAQLRADQVKIDFLAAVSHELRTPMNGMVATIELLENTELNADQKQFQDVLKSSANHLSLLLDDLFDLTRMETGLMRIEAVPTDISALLGDIERTTRASIVNSAVEFRFKSDLAALPGWLLIDAARLKQVLSNLLHNAFKFTDYGSVILRARATSDEIELSVLDTGKGLPAEPAALFEKYQQAESTKGGLGLGLSISQMLVTHMGGKMSAHHRKGGGAEFRVVLPLLLANEPSVQQRTQVSLDGFRRGAAILVVEDNPINQKVVRWSLQQMGCKVEVASDGQAAIDFLEKTKVDLLLMDCEMPGMDGFQTTQHIRRSEDAMSRLPIIALTADATQGAAERCLDAGMDDYLSKPFRRADLLRVLQRWVPSDS
jgi:signal transduction histidine kinase/CheY-like chemotaxis protein